MRDLAALLIRPRWARGWRSGGVRASGAHGAGYRRGPAMTGRTARAEQTRHRSASTRSTRASRRSAHRTHPCACVPRGQRACVRAFVFVEPGPYWCGRALMHRVELRGVPLRSDAIGLEAGLCRKALPAVPRKGIQGSAGYHEGTRGTPRSGAGTSSCSTRAGPTRSLSATLPLCGARSWQ